MRGVTAEQEAAEAAMQEVAIATELHNMCSRVAKCTMEELR